MMLMSCSNGYRIRVLGIFIVLHFVSYHSFGCFRFLDVFGFIVSDTFDAAIKDSCNFFLMIRLGLQLGIDYTLQPVSKPWVIPALVVYPLSSYYSIYI